MKEKISSERKPGMRFQNSLIKFSIFNQEFFKESHWLSELLFSVNGQQASA